MSTTSKASKYAEAIGVDDWMGRDVRVLLLKDTHTLTPDRATTFLSELNLGTNEVTASGYARVECEQIAAAWDDTDPDDAGWTYSVDTVVTPAIAADGGYDGWVFYEHITDDTDSPWLRIDSAPGAIDFDGGTVTLTVTGLWRTGQQD